MDHSYVRLSSRKSQGNLEMHASANFSGQAALRRSLDTQDQLGYKDMQQFKEENKDHVSTSKSFGATQSTYRRPLTEYIARNDH